jgi:hypothetical protein
VARTAALVKVRMIKKEVEREVKEVKERETIANAAPVDPREDFTVVITAGHLVVHATTPRAAREVRKERETGTRRVVRDKINVPAVNVDVLVDLLEPGGNLEHARKEVPETIALNKMINLALLKRFRIQNRQRPPQQKFHINFNRLLKIWLGRGLRRSQSLL